jgi:3D (Asp-Asp-Asp) domain-containing protein
VNLRLQIYRWLRCRNYLPIVTVAASMLLLAAAFMGEAKKGTEDNASQGRLDLGGTGPRLDGNAGADSNMAPQTAGDRIHPNTDGVLPLLSPATPRREGAVHARGVRESVSIGTRPLGRQFVVTAYCPCKKCCGPRACGITASGEPVTANGGLFVAADRSIPFGTVVTIPGYAGGKQVPVLDRGGAIKGNRLDVFFQTHAAALSFGRQTLTVEIER